LWLTQTLLFATITKLANAASLVCYRLLSTRVTMDCEIAIALDTTVERPLNNAMGMLYKEVELVQANTRNLIESTTSLNESNECFNGWKLSTQYILVQCL
jgi:hypothetical protein